MTDIEKIRLKGDIKEITDLHQGELLGELIAIMDSNYKKNEKKDLITVIRDKEIGLNSIIPKKSKSLQLNK